MNTLDIDRLNISIEDLIKKYQQLHNENTYLRQRESKLVASNQELQQRQESAQGKIEKILSRLKAIEGRE